MLFSTGAVIIDYDENYNGPNIVAVLPLVSATSDSLVIPLDR
jgi:hypothetical protein